MILSSKSEDQDFKTARLPLWDVLASQETRSEKWWDILPSGSRNTIWRVWIW